MNWQMVNASEHRDGRTRLYRVTTPKATKTSQKRSQLPFTLSFAYSSDSADSGTQHTNTLAGHLSGNFPAKKWPFSTESSGRSTRTDDRRRRELQDFHYGKNVRRFPQSISSRTVDFTSNGESNSNDVLSAGCFASVFSESYLSRLKQQKSFFENRRSMEISEEVKQLIDRS